MVSDSVLSCCFAPYPSSGALTPKFPDLLIIRSQMSVGRSLPKDSQNESVYRRYTDTLWS